jgi:multiple sugar transport system substrate-binding protein
MASTVAAAMLGAMAPAFAQSAADRAVEAAKQYSGITLNVFYEAGLQPLDPKNFTGPMWEELTGIKINVIESPIDQMFTKTMQAHRAGSGAYASCPTRCLIGPSSARLSRRTPLSTSASSAKR